MNVATDGKYNLKILNDAFEGRGHENEELDLIDGVDGEKKIKKRTKRPPKKEEVEKHIDNADPRTLAVVEEVMRASKQGFYLGEDDSESEANSMALMAYDDAGQRKKNRDLLKMKAKAYAANDPNSKTGKIIFDIDADPVPVDDGTFVTGVGIPGKKKKRRDFTEEELKTYQNPEDELLDRVDAAEREMQAMMKYLNSVEAMMAGDNLAQIRRMLNYTGTSVKHHSKAYTNIKGHVEEMNNDA